MYKNPVALSSERHSRTRFTPAENFQFAAQLTHIPLLGGEIVEASKYYPVVFHPETGAPLAVLGLTAGRNLYVDEACRWKAPFVPACCTRYPFALVPSAEGEQQYTLVVDESADTVQADKGKLLYNKNGSKGFRPSPLLNALKEQLASIEQQLQATRTIFAQLAEQGVLVAQKVSFRQGESDAHMDGFAAIDWEKVQTLAPEVLGQWQQSGLLDALQAHTDSLKQFNRLGSWVNA